MNNSGVDRRSFLKTGVVAAAALAGVRSVSAAEEYGPFKMGFQSYSVRHWKTLDEVLERAKELGLKYIEFYPGHLPVTTDTAALEEAKKKMDAAGVKAMAYGVVGFSEDVKANRKIFEFANAIGLYCISADFDPKAIIALDRLCEEFPNVHVGIHNHGPKHRYNVIDDVLNCVKDHHKNIGATADLGHYIRSKQDPIEVIEKLKDRLFGIHFKDFVLEGGEKEKIPGDGNLKVKETLAALKKVNFQGCISLEYESNPQNPVPDMKVALERIRAALKEI